MSSDAHSCKFAAFLFAREQQQRKTRRRRRFCVYIFWFSLCPLVGVFAIRDGGGSLPANRWAARRCPVVAAAAAAVVVVVVGAVGRLSRRPPLARSTASVVMAGDDARL